MTRLKEDGDFNKGKDFSAAAERFLMLLCFLISALIGYFLTNYIALLGT